MKQSKLGMASIYYSKELVQQVRNAHNCELMHTKTDLMTRDHTEALIQYVFSHRYLKILLLLYAGWQAVKWLAG